MGKMCQFNLKKGFNSLCSDILKWKAVIHRLQGTTLLQFASMKPPSGPQCSFMMTIAVNNPSLKRCFLLCLLQVSYRARQSLSHQAVIKMIAVWLLAFALYGPAIIFWELLVGRSRVPEDECFAEFYYSWSFLLSASTLEFFSPFISVAFFNLSIYLSIRRRRRRSGDTHLHLQLSEPAADQGEGVPLSNACGLKLTRIVSIPSQSSSPSIGKLDPSPSRSIHPSRLSRDKKIAKSLAIIVCVFAVCWAPYTLLMIIRAACRGRCIQHHWYEVTFWLLWLNSAINPFLYPLCHSSFRRAFNKILCPRRTSTPNSALRASQ